MDYKEMLERERFERLIQDNECFVCKVAVPNNNKGEKPMFILEGTANTMTVATMINFLEGSLKEIKKSFPKEAFLSRLMGNDNVSESYKNIEKVED